MLWQKEKKMIILKKDYKVKTLNNISPKGLKLLPENFTIDDNENHPDAILVRSAKMHDMEISPNVKYVGRAGAGVNNIPITRCSEKGIVVCNAPGANANAVKELVATGMLISSRKVLEGIDWVKAQEDKENIAANVEKGKKAFVGPELYGKKMGIVGLGAIGVLVANMAVDFGMKVYGFDPFISIEHAWGLSRKVKRSASAEALFRNCDYISLHIPLMEETKNYVNAELLSVANKGIRLLNMARGGLVDLKALRTALEDGTVSHYIVDFPEAETLGLPNTINIPHLGASTPESEENSATMVVDQMIDYIVNGNIKNSVNYPDCNMGVCNSVHRITVNHRNIPNMIGQITAVLAKQNINISDLTNKNKGEWAYTMIDVDSEVDLVLKEALQNIEGVVRARLIK